MPVPAEVRASSDLLEPVIDGAPPAETDAVEKPGLLKVKPDYPWYYVQYPDDPPSWFPATIEGNASDPYVGTWWLPALAKVIAKPGLCGHKTLSSGERPAARYRHAYQRIEDRHGIRVPMEEGYWRAVPCQDPQTKREGARYLSVFDRPKAQARGRPFKTDFDRQRYYRWLLDLIWRGVLAAPNPDLLQPEVANLAAREDRRARLKLPDDERAAYVAEAAAHTAAAQGAQMPERAPIMRPSRMGP